ncbi:MAG: helix-turn-helix transcriptional regulator [Bacteroidota bacterium]
MKRIHLGEFEELVLLVVAVLKGEAYGINVMQELGSQANRKVNISAVHAALRRLEQKGFVQSDWSEATQSRGGRRKRLFTATASGMTALSEVQQTRQKLWSQLSAAHPPISES